MTTFILVNTLGDRETVEAHTYSFTENPNTGYWRVKFFDEHGDMISLFAQVLSVKGKRPPREGE